MSELQLKSSCVPGTIDLNSEELRLNIETMVSAYTDYVVTEDSIAQAKKDKATLKKIQKAMSDKRIELKKLYSAPLDEFEKKVKELSALIDQPIDLISKQLDLFEQDRLAKKKALVKEMYEDAMGGLIEYVSFKAALKPEWLNASTNEQAINFDISAIKLQTENDLNAIKALHSSNEDKLLEDYKTAGLAHAIHLNTMLEEASQRAAEAARIKAEEEAARKAEEEKRKAEEKTVAEADHETEAKRGAETPDEVVIKIGKDYWEKAKTLLENNWIPFEEA